MFSAFNVSWCISFALFLLLPNCESSFRKIEIGSTTLSPLELKEALEEAREELQEARESAEESAEDSSESGTSEESKEKTLYRICRELQCGPEHQCSAFDGRVFCVPRKCPEPPETCPPGCNLHAKDACLSCYCAEDNPCKLAKCHFGGECVLLEKDGKPPQPLCA